jgi:hypothetical protein
LLKINSSDDEINDIAAGAYHCLALTATNSKDIIFINIKNYY